MTCPNCDSERMTEETALRARQTGSGPFRGQAKRVFRCEDCGERSGTTKDGRLVLERDWQPE